MRRREYRVAQRVIWTGLATTVALLIAAAAPADQVTSKGTVLRGKITGVSLFIDIGLSLVW